MARLSTPIDKIKDHYEVVVIGSGYGGGIAASRMARAGRQVCLLERGKEFQPGEYPDTEAEALGEMQTHLPDGKHLGSRTGLYDLHQNQDIDVFVGCGLGGTSLVNANVSLEAEPRVFDDERWPAEVRQDLKTGVERGYELARAMLKPVPYPEGFPALAKYEALEASARQLNGKVYRTPINVTFEDGVNHVGVEQHKCTLCGDCCSGCNHGAKNTTLMNYLPDAANHGAEIFTRTSVRWIERSGARWVVHYQILDSGREAFDAPTLTVSADLVFVSAGTLGSTEILLRSRAKGLAVSDQLGHRLTGNGDVLAFGYNGDKAINGVGFGQRKAEGREPVGPCITGVIDLRGQEVLEEGMVIEEGSIPGAIGGFLPAGLAGASAVGGTEEDGGLFSRLRQVTREAESLVGGPYVGAIRNTQTYLIMTHDNGAGRMYLSEDELRVDWPGVGSQPIFEKANRNLFEAGKALGGRYVENPIWTKMLGKKLITVHPLGGCAMGDDAGRGVVNHKGQVYSGLGGTDVYEGLYVCDGAMIPRPLGVNPLLTICAMGERACALAAADRGWTIDYRLPSAPKAARAAVKPGIQFTETMRGFFAAGAADYLQGEAEGEAAGTAISFTVTVSSDDLEAMLTDAGHRGTIVGTVEAPSLAAGPLTATEGVFELFVTDPEHVGQRLMKYAMKLTAAGGRKYYFTGFKVTKSEKGFDVWGDTSTLYITLYDGDSPQSPLLGRGVQHILPADFARQMTTMQVTNTASVAEKLKGLARFGRFFGDTLFQTYGGVFARAAEFDPDAPVRKKRALRTSAPEIHYFRSVDAIPLVLTRYRGGDKGPVILSHGAGVSSLIFSIDTIETNLTEYLFAHGYDVWLLDYRASIGLPSSMAESSADDVAKNDYPAAVNEVRRITGAASVQMVVHCYGSTTFFMSMLGGYVSGVRSVVCSQIASNVVAVPLTRVKTFLRLPDLLERMGVRSLTAYTDKHADWRDRLFNEALKLNPVAFDEQCKSAVCHRITFLYSLLYEHAQLNQATHDALHEMFGVANIRTMEHLARLVRTEHLVDFDGGEVYMNHLDRLAVPITFIHGGENQCFLPESTERTYEALRAANGAGLYKRHVIPGYGHIDCIFGKNAVRDVYPHMLAHLEETAR